MPLDAAPAPRSLGDADLAAVQGNFAVASGLKLTDALKQEDMTLPYVNVVAVKRGNESAKFARDLVQVGRVPAGVQGQLGLGRVPPARIL